MHLYYRNGFYLKQRGNQASASTHNQVRRLRPLGQGGDDDVVNVGPRQAVRAGVVLEGGSHFQLETRTMGRRAVGVFCKLRRISSA